MQYDLFISYASEDVEWARKLETDLKGAGRRTFRDQTRLQVGRRWEKQLTDALDDSQHLVVFWSANAKESDWVNKEMGRFDRNTEIDPRRRLICINLEGRNTAYSTYQHLDINFTGDPAAFDPGKWNDVLARLRTALDEDEDVERIDTVVLAVTAEEADPAKPIGFTREHFDTIQSDFGLGEADVQSRYKGGRLDWHPYGGESSIRSLLDGVIERVNGDVAAVMASRRFAWRLVSDDFWLKLDTDRPREVAAGLAGARLCLVVVDALSLQSQSIYRRAILLREYLKAANSIWIFVPPLPSDPKMVRYRELVRNWSSPLLESYFEPVSRRDPVPLKLGVFGGDVAEIRRLILGAVGDYLGRDQKLGRSPYTDYRGQGR